MSRKEPTTILFNPAQLEELRALSKRTGVSMSEYVRRGIHLILTGQFQHTESIPGEEGGD